ncbi:SUKH-4 family immunity protein [Streptomyces sp. NPDC058001]|uniref:SUKH-4 family immunity protein n=1 Tax=Streptomyces sp. NPDC058001 TaxID=3346300 RepID=UPI0036E2C6A0
MSTTKTITLTGDELAEQVPHGGTRRWLAGPGLPSDSALFGFDALRTGGPRSAADQVGDPDRLPADVRDLLVIGEVLAGGEDAGEWLLLDGGTGEVSSVPVLHDRPDLMDRTPLAPSLRALVECAEATGQLLGTRGQFAAYQGRYGTETVAEAARQLQSVFQHAMEGAAEVPLYWRITALIRPLSRIAGPGTDLALDFPVRLLDEEFGPGGVMRFEDVDFPATLTHEPTRRFLRDVGLPEDGGMFQLDTDVPLPTLTEHHEQEDPDGPLPPRADHLIRLGYLIEDTDLVIDGTTGEVHAWSIPAATLSPLNTDISTLAFTLWLLHRERELDDDQNNELTGEAYEHLASTMTEVLRTVDPKAAPHPSQPPSDEDWRYWPEVFRDEAGGVL